MSGPSPTPGSRLLGWALALGGAICTAMGVVILAKGHQPPIPRSFIFLVSVFVSTLGMARLLEVSHPELSSRFHFISEVFAGFALFSISWALSHR